MKKVVILLAIASLLAAPAFAGIRNSKHDLSSTSATGGLSGTNKSNNANELCVFCHTPHAGVNNGIAPLWNRDIGTFSIDLQDLYNSVTLEFASKPLQTRAEVIASDAPLCLSCHDGGSLANGLLNPPNALAGGQPDFDLKNEFITGNANLYNDPDSTGTLTNDHPIGMVYGGALITDDKELHAPNTAEYVDAAENLRLYQSDAAADTYVMWCSTCHDVHNSNKGTPFLNMNNAGSALCLSCHNK